MAKKSIEENANGRVSVTIPRATGKEDPNFFVGVNGKNYLIPKGQTVEVPPEVAAEIERHFKAVDDMYDKKDARMSKK